MGIRDQMAEVNEEMAFADPEVFDSALLGYVERFGQPPIALYDKAKYLQILMDQGMTQDEAEEYFGYNVIGAWVGESTPAFATLLKVGG